MNIMAEKQNLLSLWLESFVVINKSMGKLIKAALGLLLLMAFVVAACAFTVGISSPLTQLIISPFSVFCTTVILQVIAAHILQTQQPVMEAFASSVCPTIFQLISSILLGICCVPVVLVCAFAIKISLLLGFLLLIISMFLFVRFLYSFIAIAIDNKGPIEGLTYSWKLTGGANYTDALLVLLILIGSYVLLGILCSLVGLALRTLIPLYFANSFSLTSPIWWLFGLILVVLYLLYHLAMITFLILVFLNRKAQQEPSSAMKEGPDTLFIPLPDLEKQNAVQQPRKAENLPIAPQTQPASQTTPTEKTTKQPLGMETLGITRTSINTSEEDANDITQHLHQVYTPKDKDVIQHTEEDRMPTILFDDDLAQQLKQRLEENPPQSSKDDETQLGDDSIRLSK